MGTQICQVMKLRAGKRPPAPAPAYCVSTIPGQVCVIPVSGSPPRKEGGGVIVVVVVDTAVSAAAQLPIVAVALPGAAVSHTEVAERDPRTALVVLCARRSTGQSVSRGRGNRDGVEL